MDVELRDLAATPAVAVRVRVPMAELDIAGLVDRAVPRLAGDAIPAAGVVAAGPLYLRTWAWGEVADLEVGFPVDGEPAGLASLEEVDAGEPGRSSLPAGRVLVGVHVGPYSRLAAGWAEMDARLAAGGLVAGGPPWESYVDDPGHVASAQLRTELVQPLAEAAAADADPADAAGR